MPHTTLTHPTPTRPPPRAGGRSLESEYLGCFNERVPGRALPQLLGDSQDMTPVRCQALALDRHLRFYATQHRSQCWGGGVDPRYLGRADGGCAAKCAGNPKLNCGGANENALYEVPLADREFLGCFIDPAAAALKNSTPLPRMTPDACRQWALDSGFNYWGMQAPDTCLGELSFDNVTAGLEVEDWGCFQPCAGDASKACGGAARVATSLYRIIGDDPTGACGRTRRRSAASSPGAPRLGLPLVGMAHGFRFHGAGGGPEASRAAGTGASGQTKHGTSSRPHDCFLALCDYPRC